jgi:hypothetical protein
MIRSTGLEWKRFYGDPSVWKDGAYHDDSKILVDGVDAEENQIDLSLIDDAAKVELHSGAFFPDGSGDPEELNDVFRKWRKAQTMSSFVVEVPNDRVEEAKAAIRGLGGRTT